MDEILPGTSISATIMNIYELTQTHRKRDWPYYFLHTIGYCYTEVQARKALESSTTVDQYYTRIALQLVQGDIFLVDGSKLKKIELLPIE
ncbi:hypothetical protein A2533_04325 [Candidatus Falkowbacteria bacterium RIFOXYD2_FULL_35_9]|uniref:Uncharacterized protein n=1 Tax=Candidatus Falkowbacteria bacterium RIFOXYC2_FULL_36_12 TaxID=1798002 RepID=A0A1F5T3Q8_9BACT|nr:MAG: hypothetical protein A2300_03885 [Candidatus Falkowbacteria bacterium RIFOXYB2_FULL_35_7]OGF33529.1 MAG: hypothetical protein A2478_02505 [Candidatus Falkowbacteria bacterium RIFOXYC2_FULL_36_12]OGF34199.1 MAG: hypothetical protein A2223_01200 [Candidatus Falkowbacteria bacterium RIFOXYA2_FULL_35_8]OGF45696.1 MAG: hypothetical protein A2533_04325 [Candidatus Falkowbacteria bacterium RIFOXYD2_FULL_35_9]